ncbi:MAG: phenylacetate--CoA ligase family protein [Lachnospiraceae bacterium]|nr:phenylacetate--CoA ligase family protein [Lachnospiraceae bacterium]
MGYIHLLWDLYQLKKNTAKNEEQMKELQEKKLRKLLHYAYQNSAYYRRTFTQAGISEEDIDMIPLKQFPVIDKELLMQNYDELVTDHNVKQEELRKFDESPASKSENYLGRYHIIHSSGSTGIPRYFVYDDKAWGQMLLGIIRGALWGMSMIDILKLLAGKPRILYIAATDGRYAGAMAVGDGITGLRAKQEYLDINEPIEKGNQKVTKFDPNIVIGYPSAIKLMAEQVRLGRVPNHVKRVISCGEPLSAGLREFLEDTFQCPVINFYGSSESLALGLEENAGDGMVLFDDLNVIEVEDGEMYLTCLYNFTQPLIRYHLTDTLKPKERFSNDPYGFSRAEVLLCRNEDEMWFQKTDGTKEFIHPLSVEGICVDGLKDYQFVQTSEKSFQIRAEISEDAFKEAIIQGIESIIEPLLSDKALDNIYYEICFVESVEVNTDTGKKPLIIKQMNHVFDMETVNFETVKCKAV